MSRGKTEFKFQVSADPTLVEAVIRNYLEVNKFSQQIKPGANYYLFYDPMIKGKRSFEYYINGNEVRILAYLGTYEKPQELKGFVAALPKQSYRNELATLFEELKNLENSNRTAADIPLSNNSLNSFTEQAEKKKETGVIVGFVIALVGLVISCFGGTYGAILYAIEFYLALQGIHTKKKGLAIATLVLAGVSIAILLGYLALYFLVSMAS